MKTSITNTEIVRLYELAYNGSEQDKDYAYFEVSQYDFATVNTIKVMWKLLAMTNNLSGKLH